MGTSPKTHVWMGSFSTHLFYIKLHYPVFYGKCFPPSSSVNLIKDKNAKKELTKIQGVGDKVADCILLFSMQKSEAFPVDTWIKKIMNEVYTESKNVKKINEYAYNKWSKDSGIAQQYLFNYMRNNMH